MLIVLCPKTTAVLTSAYRARSESFRKKKRAEPEINHELRDGTVWSTLNLSTKNTG
jgi:hypothetical protein